MFKKLFGGGEKGGAGPSKPPPPVTTAKSATATVDAIQRLGETEELLTKRRNLLEKKIAHELERAKELTRQGNKRAALMALKKKKLYETQLEQVENNILRVNEQQVGLENLRATVETVDALRTGAHAGKATMQEMKIDDVDKVWDEINDQTDQMRQIQDAMAQPIGAAADIDEDELLGELEEMEAAQLDETLIEAGSAPGHKIAAEALPAMPSAPTTRPQKAQPAKTPEELELEALQAEMAL